MAFKNQHLERYRPGFDTVEGWCSPLMFDLFDLMDAQPFNKTGGCMEIGVHHGKFYILINSVIESQFKSYALDVFDDQSLNIDQSGKGEMGRFQANLEAHDRHAGRNTRIIKGDSTDPSVLEREQIPLGSLRFISVDGGHTTEHTVSDLHLAARLISNEGVVILDDILNYHWLGVIEGAIAYLATKPTLVPFAIGHNKLFLCKLSYRNAYFNLFAHSPFFTKRVSFLGHELAAL